ncbi:hypothetical protein [Mameliella alba]|uniref:hypothetical protein n=1 Tax=Mameliella alba TaxID=561184 RepID=UPI000B536D4D|nr:hypothetical protein [Mameliella alba]MBY6118941.1 hypothetical protein [Mameliella alba]OWV43861.1 hypothetical protein CDZ95_09385 [Mameliella alba]OWV67531.1 hypothetical protein CDZ97_03615 [Mameliella alba]
MSRPDAILHIGFNKCGSTALQQWLGDQASALADQGIWYRRMDPRDDVVCTNPQLQVLACTLAGEDVPARPMNAVLGITDRASQDRVAEDFRRDFEARVAKGGFDIWVGSSEALVGRNMTPAATQALADWLSSLFGRVRYVAYIRRPEPWLVSLYGHHKRRSGQDESLAEFAKRVGQAPFARLLGMWQQAVGPEALDVRLFREDWLRGSGLVEDFASVLGLPSGVVETRAKRLNTSFRDGLRGLMPMARAPKRPSLSAETRSAIANRNAETMAWIEGHCFADRRAEFRTWTAE